MDRDTTKRMFTHMINMMEQHDTMTISCGDPLLKLLKDVRELLKEQEEREKAICKGICDFIRGSCSTDTYEDKEYVCHVIQQMFIKEGR